MSLFPTPFHLDVYSHGFRVSRFNGMIREILVLYAKRYAQYGLVPTGHGRFERQITKIYACATRVRDEYFFHYACLEEFLQHCQFHRIDLTTITRTDHPLYRPDSVEFTWQSDRTPYDYQLETCEFFLQPLPNIKVSTLQMGKGKTLTTLFFLTKLNQRAVLVLKPMYMHLWTAAANDMLGLEKGEMLRITGSKSMKGLLDMFVRRTPAADKVKLILISSVTYRNYMRAYLDDPATFDAEYGVKPWDFLKIIRAGVRVVDEVHQFFHFNFTMDCMSHVPKSVNLSATLKSGDRFIDRLYGLLYPESTRAPMPHYERYIDVYVITYRFANPTLIRYINVMRQYSQTTFEKTILRNPQILKNYVGMIVDLAYNRFIERMEKGQKLAIFCGMVKMVEHVVASLKIHYPDLVIGRYVHGDPDTVLTDSDIIVTTLQSCGTGKDIPGLRVILNTIGLNKMDSNQQLMGRLRELRDWPDITPEFIYLADRENQKHLNYLQDIPNKLKGWYRHLNQLTSYYVI